MLKHELWPFLRPLNSVQEELVIFRYWVALKTKNFGKKNDFFEDFNSNLTEDLVLRVLEAAQSNEKLIL